MKVEQWFSLLGVLALSLAWPLRKCRRTLRNEGEQRIFAPRGFGVEFGLVQVVVAKAEYTRSFRCKVCGRMNALPTSGKHVLLSEILYDSVNFTLHL
jgi:hypothetical protein